MFKTKIIDSALRALRYVIKALKMAEYSSLKAAANHDVKAAMLRGKAEVARKEAAEAMKLRAALSKALD